MDNKKELNMEEMNKVAGGVWREINTGVSGLDAALRAEPKKSSRQIGHIANGDPQRETLRGGVMFVLDHRLRDAGNDIA